MSTLTITFSDEQAAWLKSVADQSGQTAEEIVRTQIEKARSKFSEGAWKKYIGCIEGPPDLSQRKGYSRG